MKMLKFSYYNFFIPIEEKNIYLIYNSLNNNIIEVDWEMGLYISKLNSEEIHFLPVCMIEMLQMNKNIITEKTDEFSIINLRAKNQRDRLRKDKNMQIIIAPTNMCNMRCIYCFEGEKFQHIPINVSKLKKIISQILNKSDINTVSILWFGGEPLLKTQEIDDISKHIRELCNIKNIIYKASIITNGTLLTEENWEILCRNRIFNVQVTIDGSPLIHNKKRILLGADGFKLIIDNLCCIPNDSFKIEIRINGDKEVLKNLIGLFDELYKNKLWPHMRKNIQLHWSMKFLDTHGHLENKSLYFTSYEYQKSKEDFAKIKLHYMNQYFRESGRPEIPLKINYPAPAQFYCSSVERPNDIVIDGNGKCYKCYSSIGREMEKITSIEDFNLNYGIDNVLCDFDRTLVPDCRYCKILPICQDYCNYRLVKKNQSMVCSIWRFFLDERMKKYYLQTFRENMHKNKQTRNP
jgi:uncharacterized protein